MIRIVLQCNMVTALGSAKQRLDWICLALVVSALDLRPESQEFKAWSVSLYYILWKNNLLSRCLPGADIIVMC